MQTATLTIRGMHCAACVKRVERALGAIPGVASTKVDLIAGKAVVAYEPAAATESALRDAVRALGFGVAE